MMGTEVGGGRGRSTPNMTSNSEVELLLVLPSGEVEEARDSAEGVEEGAVQEGVEEAVEEEEAVDRNRVTGEAEHSVWKQRNVY